MMQSTAPTRHESSSSGLPDLGGVAASPSRGQRRADTALIVTCRVASLGILVLVSVLVGEMIVRGMPAIRERGLAFITGSVWDPNQASYAVLPEIWGTLYSSLLALLIGLSLGFSAAIFLSERLLPEALGSLFKLLKLDRVRALQALPDRLEDLLRHAIDLLAAIPSVVYGLWGIFVVIPALRPLSEWLHAHFGWMPLFRTPPRGPGLLPAALVLAIMITPTITALSRDALISVPTRLRMASYGLGATRLETIIAVTLPTASRGLLASVLLALGRALGETMALAMLAGNANTLSASLFSPANTLAALLANNFPEAGPAEIPVLMYAALLLLGITLFVNLLGALALQRSSMLRRARP